MHTLTPFHEFTPVVFDYERAKSKSTSSYDRQNVFFQKISPPKKNKKRKEAKKKMSTRHEVLHVLFIGSGFEGTVCKYREGTSFEELRSVICDVWGPARFNYETAHGLTLPVNSNQSYYQFLDRLRRGEIESVVHQDSTVDGGEGSVYPVLRCLLQSFPATDEFGVVDPAHRLQLKDHASYDQMMREQQQQLQPSHHGMLRPVKPKTPLRRSEDEESEEAVQMHRPQSATLRPGGTTSNISRIRDENTFNNNNNNNNNSNNHNNHVATTSISHFESTPVAFERPGSIPQSLPAPSTSLQQQQQQQQAASDDDNGDEPAVLEATQRGSAEQQQQQQQQQLARQQQVSFARGLSVENAAHQHRNALPVPRTVAAAVPGSKAGNGQQQLQQHQNSAAIPSNVNVHSDALVLVIRTQVPPVCAQIRVDQGGLVGNLRAHVIDVAKRSAQTELPSNFLLSFTRPDCEQSIDVEDDSDFNFLKASIKRHGPEEICLFADVKGGAAGGVTVNELALSRSVPLGISSPLKANPFAPASRSPSRRNPLDDAANQLI